MCLKVQKYLEIANLALKVLILNEGKAAIQKLAETVLEPQICISYFRGVTPSRFFQP